MRPSAAGPWHQPLADDGLQRPGQGSTGLPLPVRGEEVDHTVHGLDRVEGVHRGDDQVAGVGGPHGRVGGGFVPDLADEDHVGVLPDRVPDAGRVRHDVGTDLPLVDQGPAVLVEDLDGILERDDVPRPDRVDVTDHRGDGGRLPRTRRPGDQDQASRFLGDPADDRGEPELGEVRDLGDDAPDDQPAHAALLVGAHAVPAQAPQPDGGLRVALAGQVLELRRGQDLAGERLRVGLGQDGQVQVFDLAVDAKTGWDADLEVQVAPPRVHEPADEVVDLHESLHVHRTVRGPT